MYTWGYIKENILAKLNLTEAEANQQNFLSWFPYYANEAMTQICSTIKPNHKYMTVAVEVDDILTMPDDFVSFNDAAIYYKNTDAATQVIVCDDSIEHRGYNILVFKRAGIYEIPYNARWFFFTQNTENDTIIPAPADVCEAIPSYVVSQCFKIDDEAKAATYRNEYEMFLARIDDTDATSSGKLFIGGGW